MQQATPSAIVRELAAEQAQTLPTSGLYGEQQESDDGGENVATDKQKQRSQRTEPLQTKQRQAHPRESSRGSSASTLLFAPFRFLDPFFPEPKLPQPHANIVVAAANSSAASSASNAAGSASSSSAQSAGTLVSTKFNCALVMQRLEFVQSALAAHQPGQLSPVLAPRFRAENSDCGVVPVIPPWWPASASTSSNNAASASTSNSSAESAS